jgi:GTP-binding protein EngB required for normal cell division
MKRTTASVNYFVVHGRNNKTKTTTTTNVTDSSKDNTATNAANTTESNNNADNKEEDVDSKPTATDYNHPSPPRWSQIAENPRSAEETLKEITQDNQIKLSQSGGPVQEKWFEIELEQEIVEMRPDTKLVLVDIPGLNEAGVVHVENSYQKWVQDHWHTFDCAVIVMDGKMGVNTEDQVQLLTLVEANCRNMKHIPIIILFNKVDEPEDQQQAELVTESRLEIEKIFGVPDREQALRLVQEQMNGGKTGLPFRFGFRRSPLFIPVSAVTAYIQLSASRMSFNRFQTFDIELIEKLGRDTIGRIRWNKLSQEEKIQEAYKIVTNPEVFEDVFNDSNFGTFLDVLEYFIGGSENQVKLIEHQLETLCKISESATFEDGTLCQQLRKLYEQSKELDRVCGGTITKISALLNRIFWKQFQKNKSKAFETFQSEWPKYTHVRLLARPMEDLIAYYELASFAGWQQEKEQSILIMKTFVNEYLVFLLNEHIDATARQFPTTNNSSISPFIIDTPRTNEESLNPYEWSLIFESVLLGSRNEFFAKTFGFLEIQLKSRSANYQDWVKKKFVSNFRCPKCNEHLLTYYEHTEHVVCHTCDVPQFQFTVSKWNSSNYLHLSVGSDGEVRFQNPFHLISSNILRFTIPSNLSDPDHFGHLPWLFCEFKMSIEKGLCNSLEKAPTPFGDGGDRSGTCSFGSDSFPSGRFTFGG